MRPSPSSTPSNPWTAYPEAWTKFIIKLRIFSIVGVRRCRMSRPGSGPSSSSSFFVFSCRSPFPTLLPLYHPLVGRLRSLRTSASRLDSVALIILINWPMASSTFHPRHRFHPPLLPRAPPMPCLPSSILFFLCHLSNAFVYFPATFPIMIMKDIAFLFSKN